MSRFLTKGRQEDLRQSWQCEDTGRWRTGKVMLSAEPGNWSSLPGSKEEQLFSWASRGMVQYLDFGGVWTSFIQNCKKEYLCIISSLWICHKKLIWVEYSCSTILYKNISENSLSPCRFLSFPLTSSRRLILRFQKISQLEKSSKYGIKDTKLLKWKQLNTHCLTTSLNDSFPETIYLSTFITSCIFLDHCENQ